MVVIPPPVVSGAGALSLRLEANRELGLGETEGLAVSSGGEPVAVTQTSPVCEGSEQNNDLTDWSEG